MLGSHAYFPDFPADFELLPSMKGLLVSREMHHGTPGLRRVSLTGLTERANEQEGASTKGGGFCFVSVFQLELHKSLSPLFNSRMPLLVSLCWIILHSQSSDNATDGW